MSRNAGNANTATDFDKDGGGFSKMKDFGFSGSIEGQRKSEPKPGLKTQPDRQMRASQDPATVLRGKPREGGVDLSNRQGLGDFTQGHTNPITSQEGFAGKMPANGGFADGGAVMGPHMHPHGQSLHRVDQGMDGSIVHHHAHGGYTTFHQDGNITHSSADGKEAVGDGAQPGGAGSVNAHPHGNAVTRTESMDDREIMRHSHGGFTVNYNDDRPPTHHNQDGTPAYHAGAGPEDFARGGRVHGKHKPKPHKPAAPKAMPVPMGGALASTAPVNRPPRNPERSVTPRNEMPGGVMPYGVEPSAEPDVSDGTAGAAAGAHDPVGLKKGGKTKERA